jgi:hypothetical protein
LKPQRLYTLIFLLLSKTAMTQAVISGKVLNGDSAALPSASISLVLKKDTSILGFVLSDKYGRFSLVKSNTFDTLLLKVTCLNHATRYLPVDENASFLAIYLQRKATLLPAVSVHANPITVAGDTTSYNVGSFANKADRVIGDVIAKLPGIDVDANGGITYNGKPISHYYIDGIDLLENRYNIANKNIDFKHVDQVQVLTNDRDMKILDSTQRTGKVALNLKMSNKAKKRLIGKTAIGSGVSPLLYDAELLGMKFQEQMQNISALKANNTGLDLANEIVQQGNVSIMEEGNRAETNTRLPLLTNHISEMPPLPLKRYLFNDARLTYTNFFRQLKRDKQFRLNLSYLKDEQRFTENALSSFFLPSDTVNLFERKSLKNLTDQFTLSLDLTKNTVHKYFKNNFKMELAEDRSSSEIDNSRPIYQKLNTPFLKLQNLFTLKRKIRNRIFEINSDLNYNDLEQELTITPGLFEPQFNQSIPYDMLRQGYRLRNFNTHNHLSFAQKILKIHHDVKVGSEIIVKNLASELNKHYESNMIKFNDSFQNAQRWINIRSYLQNNFIFKKEKHQFTLKLQLENNNISLHDNLPGKNGKRSNSSTFFNPAFSYFVPINDHFEFSLNASQNSSIGSIFDFQTGYILKNYRSVHRTDTLFQFQKTTSLKAAINFKNPFNGIFGYFTAGISSNKRNIIGTQSFNDIFNTTTLIEYDNTQKSHLAQFSINKYFIRKKANISFNSSLNQMEYFQFLQNRILSVSSNLLSNALRFYYNGNSRYYLESAIRLSKNILKIEELGFDNAFSSMNFENRVNYFPKKNIVLSLSNQFIQTKSREVNTRNNFVDFSALFKLKKIDLELNFLNILNNDSFKSVRLNSNTVMINEQAIRPFNFLIKLHKTF